MCEDQVDQVKPIVVVVVVSLFSSRRTLLRCVEVDPIKSTPVVVVVVDLVGSLFWPSAVSEKYERHSIE